MEGNTKLRSIPITTEEVLGAYYEVRKHGQSAGIDGVTMTKYEEIKVDELYKVWNRLSSGSYFPPAVRRTEIPKGHGKMRSLGIPTISDRVAQTVVKKHLEPMLEPHFHRYSFAYRPNQNAFQAIEQAKKQCYQKAWVIDLDIEQFFDNLDHELLMQALNKHAPPKWVVMYVERWLKAPIEQVDGTHTLPAKGTPQGGVISPLLSNLYLHYTFDKWMELHYPEVVFERFADDIIVHCSSEQEAVDLLSHITERFLDCGLRLHSEKTKIVYCKNNRGHRKTWPCSFEFLGLKFNSYRTQNKKTGNTFTGFGPMDLSRKSTQRILDVLRSKKLTRRTSGTLADISAELHSHLRGWINSYYGRIDLRLLRNVFRYLNDRLVCWAVNRYKRFNCSKWKTRLWLRKIVSDYPHLFLHWTYGYLP
jgi:group II intron reverse transcriptase/maturase